MNSLIKYALCVVGCDPIIKKIIIINIGSSDVLFCCAASKVLPVPEMIGVLQDFDF